jgi:hypothetical protein
LGAITEPVEGAVYPWDALMADSLFGALAMAILCSRCVEPCIARSAPRSRHDARGGPVYNGRK